MGIVRGATALSAAAALNPAEELLAAHLTELGIEYERQFGYAAGRRLRADFAVPAQMLLIEVVGGVWGNSGAHGRVQGILRDIQRLNAATLNGYRMLRFLPQQVESGEAKAYIREVLGL